MTLLGWRSSKAKKGKGYCLPISSMCNGRGIPTAKEVNDFVGLEVFKGEEGRRLLLLFPPCVMVEGYPLPSR